MIIEGIVSTLDESGSAHISPMGPEFGVDLGRFVLKPFKGSQTLANLQRNGVGVFHILDDALILAQSVLGLGDRIAVEASQNVKGWVLRGACFAWEFEIEQFDLSQNRSRVFCRVVKERSIRPFGGWNRAQFAVMELAILYSRVGILKKEEILASMPPLEILVQKTAGPREWEAWNLLSVALRERLEK